MIVKEMLLACDPEAMIRIHYQMQEPPKAEDFEQFRQMHMDFLQEIAAIEPDPSDLVLLGYPDAGGEMNKGVVGLFSEAEILSSLSRCAGWQQHRGIDQLCEDTQIDLLWEQVLNSNLDRYDMETMPWEQLLGVEVLEENLRAFGHDRMAAAIVEELSFWGLSYKKSKEGLKRFWDGLEEAMKEMEPGLPFFDADLFHAVMCIDEEELAEPRKEAEDHHENTKQALG